jgi:hypothetical protein
LWPNGDDERERGGIRDAEADAVVNKELQQAETLSHAKSEVKNKRDKIKSKHWRVLKVHLVLIVR